MAARVVGSVTVTAKFWRSHEAVSQAMNSGRSCSGTAPASWLLPAAGGVVVVITLPRVVAAGCGWRQSGIR